MLNSEEGPTLDFKGEQYRFTKASDDDKSELLKDILAFANTTRYRTAYILVGVEEVNGGRNEVVGVKEHLEDASLHQFVNSKTNRPVVFSYFAYAIEGKSIGVIEIPIQQRPVWAEKMYGVVKANEVYVRDGSSTRPASPDEVAAMGRGNPPKLQVAWGNASRREVYPADYVHRNTHLILPDLFRVSPTHYDFQALARSLGVGPEYCDGAKLTSIRERAMGKPIGLRFHNNSGSVGENVGFVATLANGSGVSFRMPSIIVSRLSSNRDRFTLQDKELRIGHTGDGIEINVEIRHIRPGEYIWAGRGFRFSTRKSGLLTWNVRFVADNLSEPIEYQLPLQVECEEREIQPQDIVPPKFAKHRDWLS